MVATLLIAVAGMVTISAIVAGAILSCCDGAECGGEDGGGQGRLGGADGCGPGAGSIASGNLTGLQSEARCT